MHQAAWDFFERATADITMDGLTVLEFGSYDVNGSLRPIFAGCARYVGVDVRPGPGVDVVSGAADYNGAGAFDLVVCAETLEHDPTPEATLASAWRALRPGGLLILSAAGPTRAVHSCDGLPEKPADEHYANISGHDLIEWLDAWADVVVLHSRSGDDVYAVARRPE